MSDSQGHRRPNGRIGVRNHVAVVPTSVTASALADRIPASGTPVETLSIRETGGVERALERGTAIDDS